MLRSKRLVFAAVAGIGASLLTATPSSAFGFEDLGVELGSVKVCLTISCAFPPEEAPHVPKHVDHRTPRKPGPKHVDHRTGPRHVDHRTGPRHVDHRTGNRNEKSADLLHPNTEAAFTIDQCKALQAQGYHILCN